MYALRWGRRLVKSVGTYTVYSCRDYDNIMDSPQIMHITRIEKSFNFRGSSAKLHENLVMGTMQRLSRWATEQGLHLQGDPGTKLTGSGNVDDGELFENCVCIVCALPMTKLLRNFLGFHEIPLLHLDKSLNLLSIAPLNIPR